MAIPQKKGEVFRNPNLLSNLAMRKSPKAAEDAFYKGKIARTIVYT